MHTSSSTVGYTSKEEVLEHDQEDIHQIAKAVSDKTRFEARCSLTPSVRREPEPIYRTMVLSLAADRPPRTATYPGLSTFVPNASVMLYLAHHMDLTMSFTDNWTENCTGWTPFHSMIYLSVLFYIQTLRAMQAASAFPRQSQLPAFLNKFIQTFPLDNLCIPGPLVEFFANISCFLPTPTGMYGKVTPSLPLAPQWSAAEHYALNSPHHYYLPNISAMISRLQTICSVASRDNMTERLFATDVNGPRYCATLFGRDLTNAEADQRLIQSPGMGTYSPGNHKLWSNAAYLLGYYEMPLPPDAPAKVEVKPYWEDFLQLQDSFAWFGQLTSTMNRYCQFWKGSMPLSKLPADSSASGAVKCRVNRPESTMFTDFIWNAPGTAHNHNTHGNANQLGHFTLKFLYELDLHAQTSMIDIHKLEWYAATTYAANLLINDDHAKHTRSGIFWEIKPDVLRRESTSVLSGVLSTLTRVYHSDTRLYPPRQ